ncbi:cytochrome p450 [Diplodia corticola]|uniref:Cytochrome p450 n=1 Tax=Diplodia corticola TaxID=236234 RepID=A0A1J9R788_9PEZI|nr:cytochrome p450 [Diplodia corticola]OJD36456.1 cytochrome p450 [Diplodia corticola]
MLLDRLSLPLLIQLFFAAVVVHVLRNKYGNGINHIPGPFLASFTDLWRLWIVWKRRPEVVHIRLHERYGKIVRIGPKTVIVSDTQAAKQIYALNAGFVKSDFYPVQQTIAKGRPLLTMFSTTDEAFHAKLRRAVSNAYAMSTIVQYEPLVDSTTTAFLSQLARRYADRGQTCDLGTWLQYYSFDVIGELTYSKRLGFVDRGEDVDGIIRDLEWLLDYVAVIGQLPILDRLFLKNPIRLWKSAHGYSNSNTPVVEFAKKRMAETSWRGDVDVDVQDEKGEHVAVAPHHQPQKRDFLSRFRDAHRKDPAFIGEDRVLALTVANMFAGSDTTAISLRAVFYHLLRRPHALGRLMAELTAVEERKAREKEEVMGRKKIVEEVVEEEEKEEEGRDGGEDEQQQQQQQQQHFVSLRWSDVRDLPYLGAVVNEALRVHPAAGLPLERIAPEGGVTLACGTGGGGGGGGGTTFLPAGTNVGCSAWALHRESSVFGADVDAFRPERWLEGSEARRADMRNCLFAFGAGARTCVGKNISLLEIYKLVPAVLLNFELELVRPDREWTIHNAWFVKQTGFFVRLRQRGRVGGG